MLPVFKHVGKVLLTPVLVILVSVFVPLLIWASAFIGTWLIFAERRARRGLIAARNIITCRIDADCPPGYMCIDGRCVPMTDT